MALRFDPYTRASEILNLKGEWEKADEERRKKLHERANTLYGQLNDAGYGDLSKQLQGSNYAEAQGVVKDFKGQGSSGKVAGRSYMKDRLKGLWGLSDSEADAAIGWDPDSGDVYLGGAGKSVNVGPGDAFIDGTNYYSDTSALDSAVDAYAQNAGLKKSESLMYNQNSQEAQNKLNQLWGMQVDGENIFSGDPMQTSWGKGIMDMYMNDGDMAGYNEIAQGIGSNGGNVDSYSQANALRQLKAFKDAGTQAVINQWNSLRQGMLDYWGGSLSDTIDRQTGLAQQLHDNAYNDRQQEFDNNQTALNNQMDRWRTQSEITGYVPSELDVKDNPYLLEDGSFNPEFEAMDFLAAIGDAEAAGDTRAANQLRQGRDAKMRWNPEKYGQYREQGNDYIGSNMTADNTYDWRNNVTTKYLADTEAATDRYTSDRAADVQKYGYDTELEKQRLANEGQLNVTKEENKGALDQINADSKYVPKLTMAQVNQALKNGELSQEIIDAYNYWHGTSYTMDNPPKINS